jgi:membrane protease YdiL (CAAX protease family)
LYFHGKKCRELKNWNESLIRGKALDRKYTTFFGAAVCSIALLWFSWFIHYDFPAILISVAALILSAFIFSRNILNFSDLRRKIGDFTTAKNYIPLCIGGILSGIVTALLYRWHLEISLVPGSLNYFVIIAALIGAMEELVFRGFIQEQVKYLNGPFSVLFSTLSHTGYKCCLFLSPMALYNVDVLNLAFWTFLFGLLFGSIKHITKSILPSLIAHAIFDIWVYSELVKAPWWVW